MCNCPAMHKKECANHPVNVHAANSANKPTPHVHAELIKQLVDDTSLEVETRSGDGIIWYTSSLREVVEFPNWIFRIKPKLVTKAEARAAHQRIWHGKLPITASNDSRLVWDFLHQSD